MKKGKKSNPVGRLRVLLVISLSLFIVVAVRLVYIQGINDDEYKREAIELWTRDIDVKPKRGVIYDRNGKKMAISINSHTLWANPKDVDEKVVVSEKLSKALGIEKNEILKMLNSDKNSVKIKQWLTKEEKDKVEALEIKGLQVADGSRRYYPNEDFASYILGFTNIDNVGLNGIEKTYNKYLSGITGKKINVRDLIGHQLPYDEEKLYEAQDGYNLVLTIDENIQRFAEETASKYKEETLAKNISIIVMDPNNGDILAMANNPNYNPNEPREPINMEMAEEWEKLLPEDLQQQWYSMWRNYAISDIYEPGSTFKTVMAAAAIEEGVANPDTRFYCNGYISGTPLKCSRWYNPHQSLNLMEGLAESCNVVFVDIGRKLGKEKTLKYIEGFGFGEKTGIDLLGEQAGLIPSSPDVIRDINLATISYGHGIAVTPIQLINSISTIANGGNLMKPRLVSHIIDGEGNVVEEIAPKNKRKVISDSTSKTMLAMMEEVVSSGTGGNATVPGYKVGGQTGTAKKIIDGKYVDGKYIGSFTAVAPAENPKMAILVIVDEPEGVYYGGSTAAPAASEVIEKTLSYMEIKPEYTEKEKKNQKDVIKTPNLIGKTLKEAGQIIIDSKLKYSVDSDIASEDIRVIKQYPAPGTDLEKGALIDIYLEDKNLSENTVVVPNLINKTKKEAIKILEKAGLKYHLLGEGLVVKQNPSPGTSVKSRSNVEIELKEKK